MTGIKVDISWSPSHPDKFMTFGTDLRLYQVEQLKDVNQKTAIVMSDNTSATLLSVNTEHQYMRCVSWYPKTDVDDLLAVGLENGKVVLIRFKTNSVNRASREFSPRHSRPCNSVAWNPFEYHLLAAGLEKSRTDHALVVWDVMKSSSTATINDGCSVTYSVSEKRQQPTVSNIIDANHNCAKTFAELGLSETTHSLQWFPYQTRTLVCGMNSKYLRIFDLRDGLKNHNVTTTKAVYGICIDPFFEYRLASCIENQIVLWDIRNFEKPVITLNDTKQIAKLAWCPTRCNVLASLSKENSVIRMHNVQQATIGNDEIEPTVVERSIQPHGPHMISSFAWHPTHENRMIVISPNGLMGDYTVVDRITLNWSPTSEIVWTHGRKLLQCVDSRDQFYDSLDDLSIKMRKRALLDYGLKMEQPGQNGDIVDDPILCRLWMWLDTMKSLHEEGNLKSAFRNGIKYEGVITVICGDRDTSRTSNKTNQVIMSIMSFCADNTGLCGTGIAMYKSPERDKALQLCGWGKSDKSFELLLERLQDDGQYERAAMIALFNLDIRSAIQILNKGASINISQGDDSNLNIVAMALSGYSEDNNALWLETCKSLRTQLKNPYLRAMFAFLTCDNGNYEEVMNETGIAVQDRVAFACHFLSDSKLVEFLNRLTDKMIEIGNLDGILLTGLTAECLPLIQKYVDLTGDVQTASLVILHTMPSSLGQDPRAQLWVESYQQLLDRWKLWHKRALFDIEWYKTSSSIKPPPHVFVSCNFCGKSISSYLQMLGQGHGPRFNRLGIPAANKLKISCCPGCRKPLPRCALCLTNMGTPAGSCWRKTNEGKIEMKEKKLSKFASWFTWCQTCRHGGHTAHITEWFVDHSQCPVTGCSCRCMSLDSVDNGLK